MSWLASLLADHWWLVAVIAIAIAAAINPLAVWKAKAWILLAVGLWWGWTGHAAHDALRVTLAKVETAKAQAQTQAALAQADAQAKAREIEQVRVQAVNAAAGAYERGKHDAQAAGDRVTADLRAGNLRLQDHWRGCEARMSDLATGAGQPDAAAELRAAGAGDLVRLADQCDAHARALQAVTQADRQAVEGVKP